MSTPEPRVPIVDENKCLSYGQCMDAAPRIFLVGEDGFSRVRSDADSAVLADNVAAIRAAAAACPTGAIRFDG